MNKQLMGGVALATAVTSAAVPATLGAAHGAPSASRGVPYVGVVSPHVVAPGLPLFVTGKALRPVSRLQFFPLDQRSRGRTFETSAGVHAEARSTQFSFGAPSLPAGRYLLAVTTPGGTSNRVAFRAVPDRHFHAGQACFEEWVHLAIRGAHGVMIDCATDLHWRVLARGTPTTGQPPTATTTSGKVPAGIVVVTPPRVVAVNQAPAGQPTTSQPATSQAPAPSSEATTSTSQPAGHPGATGGANPPSEVTTTITLHQVDVSNGAEGGEVKDLSVTLVPSAPSARYDSGTLTLGCATVSGGTVQFTPMPSVSEPYVAELAASSAGPVTIAIGNFSLSHSLPTCGADPIGGPFTIYVRYSGATTSGSVLAPDTYCAIPVVPEGPSQVATDTQQATDTGGCPDTGPATTVATSSS